MPRADRHTTSTHARPEHAALHCPVSQTARHNDMSACRVCREMSAPLFTACCDCWLRFWLHASWLITRAYCCSNLRQRKISSHGGAERRHPRVSNARCTCTQNSPVIVPVCQSNLRLSHCTLFRTCHNALSVRVSTLHLHCIYIESLLVSIQPKA